MTPVDTDWVVLPSHLTWEVNLDIDHIDLRAYLAVLWRWKWLILVGVLLASVTAAVVTLVIPPTYESSALVVVTKSIYQLQFDPRIVSEENLLPLRTAKSTHELLARDPALEQQIIDALGDALPSEERTPRNWTNGSACAR